MEKKQIESGSGWCDYCCQVSSRVTSLSSRLFRGTRARDVFDTLDPKACTSNDRLPRCHLHVGFFFIIILMTSLLAGQLRLG